MHEKIVFQYNVTFFFTELIQQPYCVSPQSVCCLCVNDSSSEGGAGPPAIRVDCLLSPDCMMKCP